jgi:hypothetical protein
LAGPTFSYDKKSYNATFRFKQLKKIPTDSSGKQWLYFKISFRREDEQEYTEIFLNTRLPENGENEDWIKDRNKILYNPSNNKNSLNFKDFAKRGGQISYPNDFGEIVIEGLEYGVRYLCNAGFTNRQSGQYDSDGYKVPIKWIEKKSSNKVTSFKRTLSAPILNSTLPAFYTTNKNISFSYDSNDTVFDWTLQARIYSAFSGNSVLINGVDFLTIDSNSAHDIFIIKATE